MFCLNLVFSQIPSEKVPFFTRSMKLNTNINILYSIVIQKFNTLSQLSQSYESQAHEWNSHSFSSMILNLIYLKSVGFPS
jgi:hypothetical protein